MGETLQGRRALVTGGSRGIGAAIVLIKAHSADVAAVAATVDQTARELGLDVLVNNAGLAVMAPVETYRLDDLDRMLAVNLRAVFGGHAGGGEARCGASWPCPAS